MFDVGFIDLPHGYYYGVIGSLNDTVKFFFHVLFRLNATCNGAQQQQKIMSLSFA